MDDSNTNISILLYADDIALIAPNEENLQAMLDCVNAWCQKWRMSLNENKTKVIHFRNKNSALSNHKFPCGDIEIKYDTVYRYLGLYLNEFCDYKYTVRELTKSASRALSAVYTKYLSCGGMSYDVYTELYNALVEPVLFYGAGIWGHTNWQEVQSIRNKACRLFSGFSKNASNIAVLGDMGFQRTKSTGILETFRLYLRVRYTNDTRLTFKVHMWSGNITRSWDNKCVEIARQLNVLSIIENQYSNKCEIFI